jgi:hypothetical protein
MMQFEGVAAVFALLALVLLFASYKILANPVWLHGWLRGNVGMLCAFLTLVMALCVVDVRSYKPMFDGKPVATISLRQVSPQYYEVRLVDALGTETRYQLSGDRWFLTARLFQWSQRLSLGLGYGYRFSSLHGEYAKKDYASSEAVIPAPASVDVWEFLDRHAPDNFLVSTHEATTVPQPLFDGAEYEVIPLGLDLEVRPYNELTKHALQPVATDSDSKAVEVTAPVSTPAPSP